MKHLKDYGFVIKRKNLFDTDRYVTIFTKEFGKVVVIAKGVKKISSRRSSHIELLNLVRFEAIKTRKNYILTDIEVINSFSSLKDDYQKIGTVFLLCELINKLCPEWVKHEDIFSIISPVIEDIERGDSLASSVFDFEVKLLTMLGFWDGNRKFINRTDVDRYIESITEKKLRTTLFFKV